MPYFLMVFLIIADNQELNKELHSLAASRKDDIGSSARFSGMPIFIEFAGGLTRCIENVTQYIVFVIDLTTTYR